MEPTEQANIPRPLRETIEEATQGTNLVRIEKEGGPKAQDSPLYQPAEEVKLDTEEGKAAAKAASDALIAFARRYKEVVGNPVAMAANQLGFRESVFVAPSGPDSYDTYVNPRILSRSEEIVDIPEMCVSGAPWSAMVPEPLSFTLEWYDLEGTRHEDTFTGPKARGLRHEIRHLEGQTCYTAEGSHDMREEETAEGFVQYLRSKYPPGFAPPRPTA